MDEQAGQHAERLDNKSSSKLFGTCGERASNLALMVYYLALHVDRLCNGFELVPLVSAAIQIDQLPLIR